MTSRAAEHAGIKIGVDLGGTKIELAAFDASGAGLVRYRVPTPAGDYAAIVEAIGALVERAEAECGRRGTVGVGTPGTRSRDTGLMINANSTVLIGKPLAHDLAARLGRPVRLANDADCFALSEAVDGAGRASECVFGVILGTGVGGGVVVRRRLLAGPHGIAGEWGHNPLPWPRPGELPGPACYCGKAGCIETFLCGPALARDHRASGGTESDGAAIAAAAAAGDPRAQATLERYVDRLARGLATVINVLDPGTVVLGGGVSNISALYEAVPCRLAAYVFSDRVTTPVLPAVHGAAGGVRGAAWLWDAPSQETQI